MKATIIDGKTPNMVNREKIKTEMKTEDDGISTTSAGFICPKCQSHFLCSDFFVEHVREHFSNSDNQDSECVSPLSIHTENDCSSDCDDITNPELHLASSVSESAVASVPETNSSQWEIPPSRTGKKLYICVKCFQSFATRTLLKRHEKTHAVGKSFNCEICSQSFIRNDHLLRHISVTHPDDIRIHLKCETCLLSFDDISALAVHKKTHNTYKKTHKDFKCETCFRSFPQKCLLIYHERTHTGERPYSCKTCSQSFTRKSSLKRHERIGSCEKLPKDFKCETCFRSFPQKCQLIYHERTHTGERPYSCKTCSRSFAMKSYLNKHKRIHEKPHKCEKCSRSFTRKDRLMNHMVTHSESRQCATCLQSFSRNKMKPTGRRRFQCVACSQSYSASLESNLQKLERTHISEKSTKYKFTYSRPLHLARNGHIRHEESKGTKTGEKLLDCKMSNSRSLSPIDQEGLLNQRLPPTGEKLLKCYTCSKCFSSSSNLTRHRKLHSGEKSFKCKICPKSFATKAYLVIHGRTHSGEKPYKCDTCFRSFSQISSLNSHKKTHKGEKPYKCDTCFRSFARMYHLDRHKRIHTGEKPYKCKVCTRSFTQKSTLRVHAKIHSS